jgi:hypothetical protein
MNENSAEFVALLEKGEGAMLTKVTIVASLQVLEDGVVAGEAKADPFVVYAKDFDRIPELLRRLSASVTDEQLNQIRTRSAV